MAGRDGGEDGGQFIGMERTGRAAAQVTVSGCQCQAWERISAARASRYLSSRVGDVDSRHFPDCSGVRLSCGFILERMVGGEEIEADGVCDWMSGSGVYLGQVGRDGHFTGKSGSSFLRVGERYTRSWGRALRWFARDTAKWQRPSEDQLPTIAFLADCGRSVESGRSSEDRPIH